jgi:hypothetical protein
MLEIPVSVQPLHDSWAADGPSNGSARFSSPAGTISVAGPRSVHGMHEAVANVQLVLA